MAVASQLSVPEGSLAPAKRIRFLMILLTFERHPILLLRLFCNVWVVLLLVTESFLSVPVCSGLSISCSKLLDVLGVCIQTERILKLVKFHLFDNFFTFAQGLNLCLVAFDLFSCSSRGFIHCLRSLDWFTDILLGLGSTVCVRLNLLLSL